MNMILVIFRNGKRACHLRKQSEEPTNWFTGNDICKDAKRQIISIEDVYTALEDLEFQELLPPLKESLEGDFLPSTPSISLAVSCISAARQA